MNLWSINFERFKLSNTVVVVSLIIIGLLVYANTFNNAMFWDDNDFILNNAYIKDFSHVPKFFTENIIAGAGFNSNYWRPALLAVFSLEWHLWGDWAPGYHIVNALMHIGAGILLFFILKHIFKRRLLVFLTAIIFLVHPVQTEAVSYANSLGDSLSVLSMFAGILLSLRGKITWPLLFYILALMSKETAIIMPGLIFIAHFFAEDDGLKFKEKLKISFKKILPLLAPLLVYVLLRATILNFGGTFNLYNEENIFTDNLFVRIFTFFKILLIYLGLIFWPQTLHMERSLSFAESFFSPPVLLGAITFFLMLGIAFISYKKHKIITFGILWFLIGISITSNILVPINGLVYEHWLYLPLVGFALSFIYIITLIAEKYNLKKVALISFLIASFLFAGRSIARNHEWRDPIIFYKQTLQHAPQSYRVTNNLGMELASKGLWQEAEEVYKKAILLEENAPVAYHNLANLYRDTSRVLLAIENYKKALAIQPDFYFSENALINLYLKEERFTEARLFFEEQLDVSTSREGQARLYYILSIFADLEGDEEGRDKYLLKSKIQDPNNPLRLNNN